MRPRTISQLAHPNICTLHDIGKENGISYLVMELLEGETLARRLLKGSLDLEEVLRYGTEISSALDKAHRAGIVHRDLKPGNVMITKNGAKLLDFGLAKHAVGPSEFASAPDAPTVSEPLTDHGTILGTFQYMAPEQLEGKEADPRTDVFALGAVLYEMTTGERAFRGDSRASLIASIMSSTPRAISEIKSLMPPSLEFLVNACLAKDSDDRMQTAFDVGIHLRSISASSSQTALPTLRRRKLGRRELIAWSVAATCVVLAAWSLSVPSRYVSPSVHAPIKARILPPETTGFLFLSPGNDGAGPPALSPDGTQLAFTAVDESGEELLWIRSLDSLEAAPIRDGGAARYPFWSPDGKSVAFFSDGALKRTDGRTRFVRTICHAPNGRGGTWNASDVIVFSPNSWGPLHQVAATGGESRPVTPFDETVDETHRWPWFLPDGKHFLFFNRLTAEAQQTLPNSLFVGSTDGDFKHWVMETSRNAVYASGYLITGERDVLFAQGFDPVRFQLKDEPIAIVDELGSDNEYTYANYTVSQTGLLAYQPNGGAMGSRLDWLARDGATLSTLVNGEKFAQVSILPDGNRAAVTIADAVHGWNDVWVYDTQRGIGTRRTVHGADDFWPVWLQDGSGFYFSSERGAQVGVYKKLLDSVEVESVYVSESTATFGTSLSPNGKHLLLQTNDEPTTANSDVLVLSIEEREVTPLLDSPFNERHAVFSPDGEWVAFVTDEPAQLEVYVAPVGTPAAKLQVSLDGGSQPRWNKSGKELFYISADRRMIAVALEFSGNSIQIGEHVELFKLKSTRTWNPYDVSADGTKFLVTLPPDSRSAPPLVLVTNWTSLIEGD